MYFGLTPIQLEPAKADDPIYSTGVEVFSNHGFKRSTPSSQKSTTGEPLEMSNSVEQDEETRLEREAGRQRQERRKNQNKQLWEQAKATKAKKDE